jgi:hypothetical protein
VFSKVDGRRQVRLPRPGIELKPFTSCLDQFAQRLKAGIAVAMLVGRHNRLGCPCPSGQLGLCQPSAASNRLDEGCRIHKDEYIGLSMEV